MDSFRYWTQILMENYPFPSFLEKNLILSEYSEQWIQTMMALSVNRQGYFQYNFELNFGTDDY